MRRDADRANRGRQRGRKRSEYVSSRGSTNVRAAVAECETCGKKSYTSRKAARRAWRAFHPEGSLNVYRCPAWPDYWHLGHHRIDPAMNHWVDRADVVRMLPSDEERRNVAAAMREVAEASGFTSEPECDKIEP